MTPEEFQEERRAGRKNFSGESLPGLDLRGEREVEDLDFSGADLSGLLAGRGSVFRKVKFNRACLRDAQLSGIVLLDCEFQDAEMQDIEMCETRMQHVDLKGAWLLGADMEGAYAKDIRFSGADMGRSGKARTRAGNAHFVEALFDDVIICDVAFANSIFEGCEGEPARSDGADFSNCRFFPWSGPEPDLLPDPSPSL